MKKNIYRRLQVSGEIFCLVELGKVDGCLICILQLRKKKSGMVFGVNSATCGMPVKLKFCGSVDAERPC
jgi:hypothetical protein